MKKLESESASFYKDLFSSAPLKGVMDANSVNIWNAYEIYSQVNYLYTHDKTVHDGLKDANDTLSKLQQYAFDMERGENTEPEDEKDKEHGHGIPQPFKATPEPAAGCRRRPVYFHPWVVTLAVSAGPLSSW